MNESPGRSGRWGLIYEIVRQIPKGKVATYGQVASLAGFSGHARQVGYALHALEEGSSVPWQRVISALGEVSPRSEAGWEHYQRHLLEEEGVEFDDKGCVRLEATRWDP